MYGSQAVFICKLLPLGGIYVLFLAGIVRMNVKKFSLYTVFASLLWCLVLVYIGLLLGPHWGDLAASFKYFEIAAVIGIIGVISYLVYRLEWKPSHARS